jgi:hypothetical protein
LLSIYIRSEILYNTAGQNCPPDEASVPVRNPVIYPDEEKYSVFLLSFGDWLVGFIRNS